MKILQVCSASEMGGGEIHVADLARALAANGHAIYLAVRPNSPLRHPLAGLIASWHEMPLRNSLDLQSVHSIAEIVKEHAIDIIHAHVGRDYLVAALARRAAPRAKLIITRHHYLPVKRNAIYRWLLQDVSAVIAVSESVRESMIERLALPADRVHTIPNWIDPARFQVIDRDAARAIFRMKANLVVACIGEITPAKGQEEFIRAAARVSRTRQDVEFIIVGEERDEGEPFTKQLKRLADSLGLNQRLTFLGYVRHIPELLAATDIVVVPSWDEGFSLVTIEAMAARRPVLGSNVGGITRIIKENLTGALFPPKNSNALGDKLIWLLSDGALRERLAAQAQRDVYTRFGREQIIERIESLYRQVMRGDDE